MKFNHALDSYINQLSKWKSSINLSSFERNHFSKELLQLDNQIKRLSNRKLNISVFGKVGVGKSSLINALIDKDCLETNIKNGSTRNSQKIQWNITLPTSIFIEFKDNPGINKNFSYKSNLFKSKINNSDLVLFVLDGDLTNLDKTALEAIMKEKKPVLIILNRCDQWNPDETRELINSIRRRLPKYSKDLPIIPTMANPRRPILLLDGRVRSIKCKPEVNNLKRIIINIINEHGHFLMTFNTLNQADKLSNSILNSRLIKRKPDAQTLIGKFATFKASGVALNHYMFFDMAGAIALDTALIVQLGKLYGIKLKKNSARKLLQKISIHNFYLGGIQIGLQISLSAIKQLLLLSTPFFGGLSITPVAPIAICQAGIAIYTTKLIGQLAAKEFLSGSQNNTIQPKSILNNLSSSNPKLNRWINKLPENKYVRYKKDQLDLIVP